MKRFLQQIAVALLTLALSSQTVAPPPAPQQRAPEPPPDTSISGLHLAGADLLQVVGIIAGELKLNYVVDPGVKGSVTINTMGDVKRSDLLPLLQMILRVNGATAVENNGLWRIMAIKDAVHASVPPALDAKGFPLDDRMVLNVIPLRYASATDLSHVLSNYLSDAGSMVVHEAGNILLITDTSLSMTRLMELIALFDSDTFAGQRVRMFQAKNSSAYGLANDLQSVFAAYATTGKSPMQFLPIERLNGVLVVSPNPAAFVEVEKWVEKLDVATRTGGIRNYVYKVQNARAEDLSNVLLMLYGGFGSTQSSQQRGGRNTRRNGSGSGQSTMSQNSMQNPSLAIAPPSGTSGQQIMSAQQATQNAVSAARPGQPTPLAGTPQAAGNGDNYGGPRIVPDLVNNMLIVQCTPPEWEEIRTTIQDMDIVPRQVLIEAQIFEVNLTGNLSMGVTAYLQQQNGAYRTLTGSLAPNAAGTNVLSGSVGLLVGRTRQLMAFLTAEEDKGVAKVISAPSILASDNQDASIEVGTSIPILTSVGFTGAQATGGGSIFTNGITNIDTGVILNVTPRVNSGGLVTLQISQEVSVPGPPPSTSIPSPTIQKRTISTQVTVQDGETIAIGGIIQDNKTTTTNRLPLLGDIPYIGALFGSTSITHNRTELIVLLTPRVVRNINEAADMTDELSKKLKSLQKMIRQNP